METIKKMTRPDILSAHTYRFDSVYEELKERWCMFLSSYDSSIIEIFVGKYNENLDQKKIDEIYLPNSITSCYIEKNKEKISKTSFSLVFSIKGSDHIEHKQKYEDLTKPFNNEFRNYAIGFSRVLQYGVPITEIKEQILNWELEKRKEVFRNDFLKAINEEEKRLLILKENKEPEFSFEKV